MKDFYKNKRVFLTGHTGFKGSWMCMVLKMLGANIYGYSLDPNTEPNLYEILQLDDTVHSFIGDIRDYENLNKAYIAADPHIVIHMAAQPLVRDSYKKPKYTYETNVMGTVNILECLRNHPGVISFLNVTTDKVYENSDYPNHAFTEEEKLDGYDPYSNSKSCSELVTHSYQKSYFCDGITMISTARAGNVIGGGDYAKDRIIPDCVRSVTNGESIKVRNPYSIRPYQHVLEPIIAYLMIVMKQISHPEIAGSYNIGPDFEDCITTGSMVDQFLKYWGCDTAWTNISELNAPHEASFLMLDNSKASKILNWKPYWHINEAIEKTVLWYKALSEGADMINFTEKQISEYLSVCL